MSNHKANGSKVLRSDKIKQIINHVTDLEERKSLQANQTNLTNGVAAISEINSMTVSGAGGHGWRGMSSSSKKCHSNVNLRSELPMIC